MTRAGGAERLIVDAAVGLKRLGHHVEIFTCFHDSNRCFSETVDGTLEVHVLGDMLFPRSLAGRCTLLCAILRQFCLIVSLLLSLALHHAPSSMTSKRPLRDPHDWPMLRPSAPFDVFFVDQLSVGLPILRWLSNTRALFYCHFPDLLMNPDRMGESNVLRSIYRLPFDKLEEMTTGNADKILVNSEFTARVFNDTFPALRRIPRVVYPGIDTSAFEIKTTAPTEPVLGDRKLLLSINRFEQKKNLRLALNAFAKLDQRRKLTLVLAGGYDERLADNLSTLASLRNACVELNLSHISHSDVSLDILATSTAAVVFLPNLPQRLKMMLLHSPNVIALLYTPVNEHLGIVPLEAMACGLPVVACSSGGPLETVDDPSTGRLREPDEEAWATAIRDILSLSQAQRHRMAQAGQSRVKAKFDLATMASELERALYEIRAMDQTKGPANREDSAILAAGMLGAGLVILSVALFLMPEDRFKWAEGGHHTSLLKGVAWSKKRPV